MLTANPNFAVTSYKWTKVAGPAPYVIANDATANTNISQLIAGRITLKIVKKNTSADSGIAFVSITSTYTRFQDLHGDYAFFQADGI